MEFKSALSLGRDRASEPPPTAAAGAQGARQGSGRVRAPVVAVKLIKVVVLCSELGCAGWSLWSSSLQCLWPSQQQCRTLLSLEVSWREGCVISTTTWMLSCG